MSKSGHPPSKSKFAGAKPALGKGGGKIVSNAFSIKYGNQLRPLALDARSKWVITEVIHQAKRMFKPDTLKVRDSKPFLPKLKHVCWLLVSHRDDLEHPTFTYAFAMKNGDYKPTTLNQDKHIAKLMSYRNGVPIINEKNAFDVDRLRIYGNRLPRVGPVANTEKLHNVGFISDRFAVSQLGFESYGEFKASYELKLGERKAYVPKPLTGLVTGIEEVNDELSVEEEEDDVDADPEDDYEDSVNSAEGGESEVEASAYESAEEDREVLDPRAIALKNNRVTSGTKATSILEVVSRTDVRRRMEQVNNPGNGIEVRHSADDQTPEVPAEEPKQVPKKRKKQVHPAKPSGPKRPEPSTGKRTSTNREQPLKRQKPLPHEETVYVESYTTVEFMEENYPKLCANPKHRDYYTRPEQAECFDTDCTLFELMLNTHPELLSIAVPFLYEMFCKHYGFPVADPNNLASNTSTITEMASELSKCVSWDEALPYFKKGIELREAEHQREQTHDSLFNLMDRLVQDRSPENLFSLHSLVYADSAQVSVGVAAEAKQVYLGRVKQDMDFNITLFNMYEAFKQRTEPTEPEDSKSESEEENHNFFA